ncbi:MAG: FHA domain-containing protein [Gemmatimonadaceae bacterium]
MPFLDLDGETRELAPETTVGSGAQAAWRIPGKDLGARHFTINLEGASGARIVPATDQNIVVVNSRQVTTSGATLGAGDVVCAGSAQFVFLANQNDARPAASQAARGDWYLVESATSQAFHLRKRSVHIGRDVNGIVIRDPQVSRHHADIRAEAGGYAIYSSGTAGTLFNDEKLSAPRFLGEGDQLRIGNTTLKFTQTLPSGAKVVEPTEALEDDLSRRETILHQEAIQTGEVAAFASTKGINPLLVAGLVIVVVVALFFMLR